MAVSTLVTPTLSHKLFMRSLESLCAMLKYVSLSICVCRQDIARTGKGIVANMAPVVNASILYRITGISVITRHVISNIIATEMTDMMVTINTAAMITEATTAEMTIVATKVMTVEMVIVK
jgi:hypothetical protein